MQTFPEWWNANYKKLGIKHHVDVAYSKIVWDAGVSAATSGNTGSPKLPDYHDFAVWYEKELAYPSTTQIYDWFVGQLRADA